MKRILSYSSLLLVAGCVAAQPQSQRSSSQAQLPQRAIENQRAALRDVGDASMELRRLFRSLSFSDGGELEDAYRYLGEAFARNPEAVLNAMSSEHVQSEVDSPMLVMLPLRFVDDPCAGKSELQRRRTLVDAYVKDASTAHVFLQQLDQSIQRKEKNCKLVRPG